MAVKIRLHHFIWASLLCCLIDFILGASLLGYSIFNHESEKRHVSVSVVDDWVDLSEALMYFSSVLMVVSLFSVWGVTKRKKKNYPIAIIVLCVFLGLLAAAICCTIVCSDLVDKLPIDEEEIFNSTKEAISKGAEKRENPKWIPIWLDSIQNDSEHCCGVITFRDWNEFWQPQVRGIKNNVPLSCCRKIKGKVCPTDLSTIPFPDTVADNIKVDSGCGKDINKFIDNIMNETLEFLEVVTIMIGISFLVILAQYIFIFFIRKKSNIDKYSSKMNPEEQKQLDEQNWDLLKFFPNMRILMKDKNETEGGGGGRISQNDSFTDTNIDGDSVAGGGESPNIYNNNGYTRSNASSNNQFKSNESTPTAIIVSHPIHEDIAYYDVGYSAGSSQEGSPVPGTYIKNALGYIERVPASDSDHILPYQGLNDDGEYKGPQGTPRGVLVSQQTDEDSFFPDDDIGSPPPAPQPGRQITINNVPSVSEGTTGTGRRHHRKHRVQIKSILRSPSKDKQHGRGRGGGHHHHHRKDGQPPQQ